MERGSSRNSAIALNKFIGFIQRFIGGIGMFVFGCGLIVGVTDDEPFLAVFCLVIIVLFFLLWRNGRRRKKLTRLFLDYARRLSSDPARSVDNLAASRGEPVEMVRKNVAGMLKMGFFPGAYLNGPLLIFREDPARSPVAQAPGVPSVRPPEIRQVTCPGCGAAGVVPFGSVVECEFCGSPLGER